MIGRPSLVPAAGQVTDAPQHPCRCIDQGESSAPSVQMSRCCCCGSGLSGPRPRQSLASVRAPKPSRAAASSTGSTAARNSPRTPRTRHAVLGPLNCDFGTHDIALILACITRGLLLATALQQRVQSSAARLDADPKPAAPSSSRKPSALRAATARRPIGPTSRRAAHRGRTCPGIGANPGHTIPRAFARSCAPYRRRAMGDSGGLRRLRWRAYPSGRIDLVGGPLSRINRAGLPKRNPCATTRARPQAANGEKTLMLTKRDLLRSAAMTALAAATAKSTPAIAQNKAEPDYA